MCLRKVAAQEVEVAAVDFDQEVHDMDDVMVRAVGLHKVFKDKKRGVVHAVNDLSFEAKAGEIFAILGPNGAGKTTTLRMLSTILRPTEGYAVVAGFDVMKEPEKVRFRIGYLPSESGLYHRLTPKELVMFFGRVSGLDSHEVKKRMDELFESLGITEFANTKIEKLSTGMKQKVAVARTIIHNPPVLILDEPTQGLDVVASRVVENFILNAKREGKCVILSTHIMEEAEYLADKILVINKGTKRALGTMADLRKLTGKERLREIFLELISNSGEEQ